MNITDWIDLVLALMPGTWVTLQLTLGAAVVAAFMSFLAGMAALSAWWPVRAIAIVYIEVFRGTSALVQLFFAYFVLPLFGIMLSPVTVGVAALGLNIGSYGAEIVRSSIINLDKGQKEAALALNMSPFLRMRRIILPQAIVSMLPSFGNLAIELLKLTALASFITISELTFTGNIVFQRTGHREEIYLVTLIIYFIIALFITAAFRFMEKRIGKNIVAERAHDI